jgi:hypothetical protein
MLGISKPITSLDDALELEYSDIQLVGYDPYPDIADKPGMAV